MTRKRPNLPPVVCASRLPHADVVTRRSTARVKATVARALDVVCIRTVVQVGTPAVEHDPLPSCCDLGGDIAGTVVRHPWMIPSGARGTHSFAASRAVGVRLVRTTAETN